jgi:hypothetical protein
VRWRWLLGAALMLSGCGDQVEVVSDPQRLITAQAVDGELALTVGGWIDNRAPVSYGPQLNWMPFAEVVSDGARVADGDILVRHDVTMIKQWITTQKAELMQLDADISRQRLERERELAELQIQATEARAEGDIRSARLESSHADEQSGRHLAEMQAQEAAAVLARAERTLTAVEQLAARGRVPTVDVVKARTARDQARFQAAVAERASREWDDGAKAIARQQLELDCERSRRELDVVGGINARIAILRQLVDRELEMVGGDQRRVSSELAVRQAFVADPVMRSHTVGTVRLRDSNVRSGAKLPSTPCLFVLEDQAMMAYVRIPEALRDLVTIWTADRPDFGRAELRVPAVGEAKIPGRVLSIAAAPEKKDGMRAFLAVIQLDVEAVQLQPGMLKPGMLKPGMAVSCDLLRPVHGAALPTWAVHVTVDVREPQIRHPDGRLQVVRGVQSGNTFVITDGLAAGAQVLALANTEHDPATTRPRRLTGLIEPTEVVPVRLKSGFWDIVEVVPDGTRVSAGQRVARLAKSAWWLDPEKMRWEAEENKLRAEAERAAARLRADQALAEATRMWRNADLDLRAARLAWLASGLDDATKKFEAAEVERVEALAMAAQAQAQVQAAGDPRVAVSLSRNGIADAQLADARARHEAQRTTLAAAAARTPDVLNRLAAASTMVDALAKADDARSAWYVARTVHGQKYDYAEREYARNATERERDERELFDDNVFAPTSGRLFHRNPVPFRTGDSITSQEPFRILPDVPAGEPSPRKLNVEVPAHLAGTWHLGDTVQVTVPGVGSFPATVQVVGTWYGTSTAGREEAEAGGSSTAVDEQVFNLTLRFLVPSAQAEHVLPGMTAYVE